MKEPIQDYKSTKFVLGFSRASGFIMGGYAGGYYSMMLSLQLLESGNISLQSLGIEIALFSLATGVMVGSMTGTKVGESIANKAISFFKPTTQYTNKVNILEPKPLFNKYQ